MKRFGDRKQHRSIEESTALALCSYLSNGQYCNRSVADHYRAKQPKHIHNKSYRTKSETKHRIWFNVCLRRRRSSKIKRNSLPRFSNLKWRERKRERNPRVLVTIESTFSLAIFPGIHSFQAKPNQFRRDAMIFHRFSTFSHRVCRVDL